MKMKLKKVLVAFTAALFCHSALAQTKVETEPDNYYWLAVGGRTTGSFFDGDGIGLGTGGQIRIQPAERINTDWYFDYITVDAGDNVRSDYYHIGWSLLFYPFKNQQFPKTWQPYIVAGHCFDYNKKTEITNPENYAKRWGSAVQAGIGTHFNLSPRFDISLTCQYMIHLTTEIEAHNEDGVIEFHEHDHNALEGHLLTTISLNYKLFRLWKK